MPRLDKTGPRGLGSMTGRGLGSCSGGMSRGCGCGFRRFISPKNELATLKQHEQMLKEELEVVAEEISVLQKQN